MVQTLKSDFEHTSIVRGRAEAIWLRRVGGAIDNDELDYVSLISIAITLLDTGAQINARAQAARLQVVARYTFGVGLITSFTNYRTGETSGFQALLNVGVSAIGTFGGHYGTFAAAGWFIGSSARGWVEDGDPETVIPEWTKDPRE